MGEETSAIRNNEVSSLLDYGFAMYKSIEIINKNTVVAKEEVEKGKDKYVEIVPKEDFSMVLGKSEQLGEITYEVKINSIKAPIKIGDVVGNLIIKNDNKKIGEIELTINKNIDKANFIELYLRYLNDLINGKMGL